MQEGTRDRGEDEMDMDVNDDYRVDSESELMRGREKTIKVGGNNHRWMDHQEDKDNDDNKDNSDNEENTRYTSPRLDTTYTSSTYSKRIDIGDLNPLSTAPIVHHSNNNQSTSSLHQKVEIAHHQQNYPYALAPTPSSSLRPRPRPLLPLSSSSSYSRPSPYSIPLPLSSSRSTIMSTEFTRQLSDQNPTTPTQSPSAAIGITPTPGSSRPIQPHTPSRPPSSISPKIASPSGSMSMSKRRQPPAWPSPRHTTTTSQPFSGGGGGSLHPLTSGIESHTSHRQLIARSAGLISPYDYARTPAALRVPPTPQYSPAFYRSGYNRHHAHAHLPPGLPHSYSHGGHPYHPPRVISPGIPIPHSANSIRPRYLPPPTNSAPVISPRLISPNQQHQLPPRSPVSALPAKMNQLESGKVQLQNVPASWVVKELNANATNVWWSPESTDCRVIVPVWSVLGTRNEARARIPGDDNDLPDSATSIHSNQPGKSYWPPTPIGPVTSGQRHGHGNGGPSDTSKGIFQGKEDVVSAQSVGGQKGRRGSLPERDQIPVIVFPLHQDYLITQSKLFRLLLSSTPPHLDMPIPSPEHPIPSSTSPFTRRPTAILEGDPDPSKPLPEGALKGAKIMPTARGEHPAIYVPLPDPGSLGVIIHWLYWGDTNAIEIALSKGLVSWQGLVHNIDYLDLDDGIKRVVGKWWRKWIKTESQVGTGGNGVGSQIGRRSNAGPSEEWFDGDGDGDEQPSPLSPTGGKDDVTDGDEADVEEDALSGNVLGKKGKEATMEKQRDQAKDSAGMKAKRWVRGNGDLDEGMVGRLRNL